MAGEDFLRAELDVGDVERGFAAMRRRGRKLAPLFKALRRPLRADQRAHARKGMGPDGPWPARARSTEAALLRRAAVRIQRREGKPKRRRKVLSPLGTLPLSLSTNLETDRLQLLSKVRWSGVQLEGGRVGRGSLIPARRFLWMSDRFLAKATQMAAEHLAKGWTGKGA